MNVEYQNWYSYRLSRMMEFKMYGHAGKPIIVFPSSGGRFFEFEDFKMIEAVSWFIDNGLIRIITPDSIDSETWLNHHREPTDIARHHNAYDAYIIEELIPFLNQSWDYEGKFMAMGCSLGAFHAANIFFRHPEVFDSVIALSGIYDARYHVGETLSDFDVYTNSPVDYLRNMTDPYYLDLYRHSDIIVACGQGAYEEDALRDTRHLQKVLSDKGIDAWIDVWGYDVSHDWFWWRKMMTYYLGSLHDQDRLKTLR